MGLACSSDLFPKFLLLSLLSSSSPSPPPNPPNLSLSPQPQSSVPSPFPFHFLLLLYRCFSRSTRYPFLPFKYHSLSLSLSLPSSPPALNPPCPTSPPYLPNKIPINPPHCMYLFNRLYRRIKHLYMMSIYRRDKANEREREMVGDIGWMMMGWGWGVDGLGDIKLVVKEYLSEG